MRSIPISLFTRHKDIDRASALLDGTQGWHITGRKRTGNRKNKRHYPNIFIDADKRESIERWFTGKGYKSFNEYVCALIDQDMMK